MLLAIALISVGSLMAQPIVHAEVTIGTVDIQGTCSFGTLDNVSFGQLGINEISDPEEMNIENNGNRNGILRVEATNWFADSNGDPVIDGEQTRFDLTNSTSYAEKTEVDTSGPITMGTIFFASTNSTYWQLDTTLASGFEGHEGLATQTLTFALVC